MKPGEHRERERRQRKGRQGEEEARGSEQRQEKYRKGGHEARQACSLLQCSSQSIFLSVKVTQNHINAEFTLLVYVSKEIQPPALW